MSYIVEATAARRTTNVRGSARLNQGGEVVMANWLAQLMLDGRIFSAGHGTEETGVTSVTSADVQTPTFVLHNDDESVVAIPLWMRVYFEGEGGAAPNLIAGYCQLAKLLDGAGTAPPPTSSPALLRKGSASPAELRLTSPLSITWAGLTLDFHQQYAPIPCQVSTI